MRKHHVGNVVVVQQQGEQNVPIGNITDRNLAIELLAEEIVQMQSQQGYNESINYGV